MNEEAIVKEILSIPYRCYICERLDRIEIDYISEIQYQVTRNNNVKSDLLAKGFCNYHFWTISFLTTPEAVASMGIILIENNSTQSNSCLICDHLKPKEAELVNEFVKDAPIATCKDSDQSGRRVCQQ